MNEPTRPIPESTPASVPPTPPSSERRPVTSTPAALPPVGGTAASGEAAATDANQLTPEEQMARFEQELKETDWGHQPC